MLDFRSYRCALMVARHGNFGRAAEDLHLSQPSLSRLIKEVEEQLGVRIFKRTRTGVIVTDEGEVFLGRARDLLREAENLESEFRLIARPGHLGLQVGAGVYPSSMMMDKAVVRLVAAFPTVPIDVLVKNWQELVPAIQNRSITLAVVDLAGISSVPGFTCIPLKERVPYCALRAEHPLLQKGNDVDLSGLLQYPSVWPGYVAPEQTRRFIENWKRKLPSLDLMHSKARLSCTSPWLMKSVLMNSNAWGAFFIGQLLPELGAGAVRLLPGLFDANRTTYGVIHLSSRKLTKEEHCFIEMVREEDAKLFEIEQEWERKLFADQAVLSTTARKS